MNNIGDKTSLFTEINAEEAAAINGGFWKRLREGTRNTKNYVKTVYHVVKAPVMIPVGIAINIFQKQLNGSGHIA